MNARSAVEDAVIIGAGVAGAAAAIHLARAGRRIVLFDREPGPTHKVCGEFVSAPAARRLRALGLEPASLGAQPIRGLRLLERRRAIEVELPFEAWGLSRCRLDTALRDGAVRAGARLRLGCTVRTIAGGAIMLREQSGAPARLAADAIILATGKHDLPGHRRPLAATRRMVGFKLHLRLAARQAAALADRIELHFFPGGYAGLQPVDDGMTNLSLVMDERHVAAAGKNFGGVLAAIAPAGSVMADRLAGHEPLWPKPLAIAGIPYGYRIWRAPAGPDWLWPIGDQAIVTPSFTGDGMALALASAEHATSALLQGSHPAFYRRTFQKHAATPLAVARLLNAVMARPGLRMIALAAGAALPSLASLAARATRIDTTTDSASAGPLI